MTLIAERPSPAPARRFRFPPFSRTTLGNGLTVIFADLPGRPLGTATLLLDAGPFVEDPERAGVALLTARGMQEGTSRRDAPSFSDAVEGLGADLSIAVTSEMMHATIRVPVSHLTDALSLLAEAVTTPSFPEDNVARLRAERLAQIEQEKQVPMQRAVEAFMATVFTPDSPYARPLGGTTETISRVDRDTLVAHHAANVAPARATLIVAGDLRGLDAPAAASHVLGGWIHTPPAGREAGAAEDLTGRAVLVIDRPGSVQSNIVAGHMGPPRSTPDHTTLEIWEQVYGGSFGSRLNTRLREEKGYTYGARGGFEYRRRAGLFVSTAAVEAGVTGPAAGDLMEVLTEMVEGQIAEDEFERARAELAGAYALRFETAEAVSAGIAELTTFGLPDDTFDTYGTRLGAVTVADAEAAARAHIHTDRLAMVVVGDAASVTGPLREAGIGPVEVVTG